jgi:hypothetical protein
MENIEHGRNQGCYNKLKKIKRERKQELTKFILTAVRDHIDHVKDYERIGETQTSSYNR